MSIVRNGCVSKGNHILLVMSTTPLKVVCPRLFWHGVFGDLEQSPQGRTFCKAQNWQYNDINCDAMCKDNKVYLGNSSCLSFGRWSWKHVNFPQSWIERILLDHCFLTKRGKLAKGIRCKRWSLPQAREKWRVSSYLSMNEPYHPLQIFGWHVLPISNIKNI